MLLQLQLRSSPPSSSYGAEGLLELAVASRFVFHGTIRALGVPSGCRRLATGQAILCSVIQIDDAQARVCVRDLLMTRAQAVGRILA